jgi:photosystem II stability/assembly factor-like uncharacterized protein
LLAAAALLLAQPPVRYDSGTVSGLAARNIGSAAMSGRIAAIDAIDENGRLTVFAGSASGGVWKSVNGGTTFKPVFDSAGALSIGAVAIDPSNPKIVWAGTGESWMRNSVSIGDGIYKSTDGGENWTNMGLKDSEHIAKILVDPANSNNVLACATGHLWDDNDERGIYKTTDGGKTWKKALAGANTSTGCAMLARSTKDPGVIFASMWDFRRQAWTFRSGGPGSALYKSTDGGEKWIELTQSSAKGLPAKPYGRIALAVAPTDTKIVYAMIESAQSALFRSDDGGITWTKRDASQGMVWRPFYFANLIVDPKDAEKVFKVDGPLVLSVNGGKSFSAVSGGAHGDFHDVWIHPANTNTIFASDDGGLWRSLDGGTRWEHMMNLPVSQFYHVSVDGTTPYHVYGGLQDNSSWAGDSSYPGGVTNARWENLFGGDGFWTWEDPSDSTYIYAESQGGEIGRVNRYTHETRAIKPYPMYGEGKLRFNWNTPIQMSQAEKGTIYMGAQFLFRSRNHGQSWERISPDLTTNNPEKQKQEESGGVTVDNSSAEMNNTIYSISEAPRNAQVIWVGTDDGNVQVTTDGGKTWKNAGANMPNRGKDPWVSWVEASRFGQGTAYVTLDRHMYGDMQPHLYRTINYGETWTELLGAPTRPGAPPAPGEQVRGYAHVIKEDTVNPNLLFLGTEFGLWISIDGGQRWAQYKGSGLPSVAVRDIVVHPQTSDLVLATHGRGIWIVDDISPWRSLNPGLLAEDAGFLPTPLAVQWMEVGGGWAEGDGTFRGPSRPTEAAIPYYQRSRHIYGDLKIEIFDPQGKLVDTIAASKHRGVNRATWSMHLKPPLVPPAATAAFAAAFGPRVMPGLYTVKMTRGDKVYNTLVNVVPDPRAAYSVEDRRVQFELMNRLVALLNHMSWAVDAIITVRDAATAKKLPALADAVDKVRAKIVATKEGGAVTGEERLREYVTGLYGDVNGYEGRPTDSQIARTGALARELEEVISQFQELVAKSNSGIAILREADWQKTHQ